MAKFDPKTYQIGKERLAAGLETLADLLERRAALVSPANALALKESAELYRVQAAQFRGEKHAQEIAI